MTRHDEIRERTRAKFAQMQPAAPSREAAIRVEAERRIAAGILVDGAPFAPVGADFLRIADHVGDYKNTPSAGDKLVKLRVGGRPFALELRDLDAAADRLAIYSEAVSAAADAAIGAGTAPAWPPRPNLRSTL